MANSNKPTPSPRKYDKAFKAEALRMLDEGQSVSQVAKSLNVSDQLLYTKHSYLHPINLKAMYRFIWEQGQYYPVQVLCQTLEVNRSGYYEWLKPTLASSTKATDSIRTKIDNTWQIKDLFDLHRRRYGSRRLVSEMKDQGVKISRDFVRKVLVENQLRPIQPRSFMPRTTDSRHTMGYSPNLLLDRPHPSGPNQVWPSRRCGLGHNLFTLG